MFSNFNIWQLLGGLGLFLFAMGQIEGSLSNLGSKSFKNFLIRHTDRPIKSILSGGVTTAMLQSSSLVGLLILAFTGAGLISLENALGVIFGANLGTTLTGWIVATIGFKLDLDTLSLPLIAVGSFLSIMGKGRKQEVGRVIAAIGLLLLGLEFMKDSVANLKDHFDINTLKGFSAWQYLIFGAIFAAVVQSSSATMIIALASLDGGVITLPAAAAIAIGADLGTTSTLVLGAINGTPNKKRVAAAHVIFNVTTDLIAFLLIMPLLSLITAIGIKNPLYILVAFHSLFNLLGILIFIPLIKPLAKFLNTLFVLKKVVLSHYLSQITPVVIDAGLIATRKETSHLIHRILLQNAKGFEPFVNIPAGPLPIDEFDPISIQREASFMRMYHETKLLEGEILLFATDLQTQSLEAEQTNELGHLLSAVRNAMHSSKNIKDIQNNISEFSLSSKSSIDNFIKSINRVMGDFYNALYELKVDDDIVHTDELAEITKKVQLWHDELHQQVVQAIHRREVIETEGSSMLNVNREILNSNLSMITALHDYHQDNHEFEKEYVEPLN